MAAPAAFWDQVCQNYDAHIADFYVSFADHPGATLITQPINQTITSGTAPDAFHRGYIGLMIAQFHSSHASPSDFALQPASGAQGNVEAVTKKKSGLPKRPAVAENVNVAAQSASTVNGSLPIESAAPFTGNKSAEQAAAQRAVPANGDVQATSAVKDRVAAPFPSANQGVVQRDGNQVQQTTITIPDDDSEKDAGSDAGEDAGSDASSASATSDTHEEANRPRRSENRPSEKAAGKKRKIDDVDAEGPGTGGTSWSDQQGQRLTLLEQKVQSTRQAGRVEQRGSLGIGSASAEGNDDQRMGTLFEAITEVILRGPIDMRLAMAELMANFL